MKTDRLLTKQESEDALIAEIMKGLTDLLQQAKNNHVLLLKLTTLTKWLHDLCYQIIKEATNNEEDPKTKRPTLQ